jgi:hypothetical protein
MDLAIISFHIPGRTSSVDEWEKGYHKTDAMSIKPQSGFVQVGS